MSALRERVAKSIAAPLQGRYADDPDFVWGSLLSADMQERFLELSGAAMAVIAQDRAARLEARMPEIEAAIDDYGAAEWDRRYPARAVKDRYAREKRDRLLALIREVAV